jgi:hypothetical protein
LNKSVEWTNASSSSNEQRKKLKENGRDEGNLSIFHANCFDDGEPSRRIVNHFSSFESLVEEKNKDARVAVGAVNKKPLIMNSESEP